MDGCRGQRRLLQGQAFDGLAQRVGEAPFAPVTSPLAGESGESLAAILSGPASGRAEGEAAVTGHAGQGDPLFGKAGRPRLAAIPGLLLGQVIKHHRGRCLVEVTRRVVLGTAEAITAVLAATGTGTGINTSYIERLNATFRSALNPLVRRGRAIVHGEGVLTRWMYLVGCAYNFCCNHDSLRVAAPPGERLKWRNQPPAMAAGLTDHQFFRDVSSQFY